MILRKVLSFSKVMLFALVVAVIVLTGCPSASDNQSEIITGKDVSLSGLWQSDSISYTFNGKQYAGIVELRFSDKEMQINAPHGVSKLHEYSRNGISLFVTDPYSATGNPNMVSLSFSDGNVSASLVNLSFMNGLPKSISFKKIQDSVTMLDPTVFEIEEKPSEPVPPEEPEKPEPGTFLDDVVNNLCYMVGEDGNATVCGVIREYDEEWSCAIPKEFNGVKVTSIDYFETYVDICRNLSSITIHDGIESIGDGAFDVCFDLERIVVDENNPYYKSVDGVLYSKDGSVLICYPSKKSGTEFSIPDTVTEIKVAAFANCINLTRIHIPDSVASIGKEAFFRCTNLESIIIPDGLTTIEESLFFGCKNLKEVSVPAGITSIGNYAFKECSSLVKFDIPESVTSIGIFAFGVCSSLESIKIPDGVEIIEESTFSGCTSLESIKIPDGVEVIEEYTFSGCTSLSKVEIGDGVTSIGKFAFRECTALEELTLGDSITSIDKEAFRYSYPNILSIGKNLAENIEFGELLKNWTITSIELREGVTYLSKNMFRDCSYLEEVSLPNTLTSIGFAAFCECKNLASIKIPESVTSIGSSAFNGCSSLGSITIPNGVTTINNGTFYRCTSLTEVSIPENVTSIGSSAFGDCSSLTEVIIPDSVASIDFGAFYDCSGLKKVKIGSGIESIANNAFYRCYNIEEFLIDQPENQIPDAPWGLITSDIIKWRGEF